MLHPQGEAGVCLFLRLKQGIWNKPMNHDDEWWRTFFSGLAVDSWRQGLPPEYTLSEVDFITARLGLSPGAKVLDVPCGHGRHAVELARRGFLLTGIDQTAEDIAEARRRAREGGLQAEFEARDMRDLPWEAAFDGAFCMGNSFGYLDDAGNAAFLRAVSRALTPGGRFILNAAAVAEAIFPRFTANSWHALGDIFMLRSARHDHVRGRSITDYTFLRDGTVERKSASYRVYTYRELAGLLEETGFKDLEAFGSPAGEPFQLGAPTLYVQATRR